ncbi:MAG: DUF4124 domain-containing protein [Pseudomonadota bacterium]
MKTRLLMAGLTALAITVSGAAMADSIYKWTDAEGNVHYGDRPSGEATEERLQITYARTSSSSVKRQVDSYRSAADAREDARTAAAESRAEAAEQRAAEEERMARCEQTRAQLAQMLEARRVYREDENGERVYLDDVQRAEARARAEEQIEEHCS